MTTRDIIEIEKKQGFVWVYFPVTVTVDNYRMIENKISGSISGAGDKVVVDMGKTENVYSSGIGLLVRLSKTLAEKGGELNLVNVSKKLRDLLDDMHLEKVLKIYATDVEFEISLDEAIANAQPGENTKFVFDAKIINGICRLTFSGFMDALHDMSGISEFAPAESTSYYLLNLKDLDVLDTYGSQLLLELIQKIGKRGGKCVTYGANEMVLELLNLLSFEHFVHHFKTEKDALQSIKKK